METNNSGKGFAVASLVLGIISVICIFISWAIIPGIIGLLTGIIGTILAVLARKSGCTSGMATAGLALSIIGLILCAIVVVCIVGCSACIYAGSSSYGNLLY